MGTMELHIPKLREGSYFPSLLEPLSIFTVIDPTFSRSLTHPGSAVV